MLSVSDTGARTLGSGYHAFAHAREASMLECSLADSAELAILIKAVDDHNAKHDIARGGDRERIALRVAVAVRQGIIDPAEPSAAVDKVGQ